MAEKNTAGELAQQLSVLISLAEDPPRFASQNHTGAPVPEDLIPLSDPEALIPLSDPHTPSTQVSGHRHICRQNTPTHFKNETNLIFFF